MENPNSAKVRYSVDGSYYDIPSDKVEDFERDTPQARQVYRVGEETYAIPLDKRDGFMAQYPDATFWNEPEQQQNVSAPQQEQPAPSFSSPQPEKQGFWARLGRNLSQAESSPQGVSMPEPTVQPQTPKQSDLPENWEERSAEFDADYDNFSKVIDAKLAEKTDVYKQRSMEREKGMGRFLSGIVNAGQAEGGAITPQAREEIAAGGDPDADQLRAAAQLFESAKKTKDAAYNQKGVLGGLADSATADTWDFGITDMKTAQQVYKLAQKIENNEELTENDNLLLEAMMQNAFANEYYSGQLKRGYKAGQVTGESLPFMLEFLMNPLAGGEKAASGGAIKVLEKNLAKRMAARAEKAAIRSAEKSAVRAALEKGGQVAMKALARGGDDVLSAAGMAATTGSIRTLEDAYSRKTGDVQFHEDPDGGLVFDGFNGAEKDWWKAAAKAYGATTIEDFSEMFGNYFRPIGQTAKKGLYFINRKIGLGKVNDLIEGIGAKEWARAASEFLDRTDWNGPISEFGEEIVGGVMNALTVGDQTLSASDPEGVFNKDNMIDTFLGVALFGGVVSAMKTVGYSREAQRNSARRSDAIDEGERLFGEDWQRIQRQIDAADEQAVKQIVATALEPGSEYTPEQKKAIGEYAGIRMVQIGMEKGRKKRDDYVNQGVEEGMTAATPEDINRLQIDSEYAQAKANRESENGEISGATEMEIEHAEAVQRGRRDSVRGQIVEQTGQPFWNSVEAEDRQDGQTAQDVVDVITYADGREAYIISDDGAGTYATVDATGKKGFITEAQIEELTANNEAVRGSVPLDEYLDGKIGEQNTQAEQQRMAQDAANNLTALQQRVQEEGRINVGTPENEQMATVIDMLRDPAVGGVVVQVEGEPQPRTLSWKEVATAYGMPLEPKSNREIVNERLDAEEEADNYNKGITPGAELAVPLGDEMVNYQFKNAEIVDGDVIIKAIDPVSEQEVDLTPEMVANLPELIYGDVAAMPVSDVQGNPVPAATTESAPAPIFDDPIANSLGISRDYAYTTKRGEVVVDGSKLWAENPTLWAEWNDRNPNRVIPTKEYLESKLSEIDRDVETARKNLEAEAMGNQNPDAMEDLQDILNRKEARQREVSSLIAKYDTAQQTAAREAENAQREQESVEAAAAPQTADEIVFSAQAAMETAKNGGERAAALQKMFDDLGTQNTMVTTSEAILADMRNRGASAKSIREVAAVLEEAAATNQRVEGFFDPSSGTIYMLADQIGTAEDANRVQIHEDKHMENDQTGAPSEAVRTGVTREEMAGAMRRRKKTRFYDNKPSITLADELLAVSAEIAEEEGVEAIPQRLRELGITNEEFINFVQNNIDDGRRNGQRRHIERRNPLQPETSQVSGGQDGRDREPEPAGVGRPGDRPDEGGRQGAGGGEVAEPAAGATPAVEETPRPSIVGEEPALTEAQRKALAFVNGTPADEAQQKAVQQLNDEGLAANSEEVRFSVRYTPSAKEANAVAKDIAKALGVPLAKAKRWVKSETSLATLILDEHNSPYLDYEGDERYTAIKQDSDYPQGTVDFNNICRKRIAFTQMYQRIQKAFPNTIITGQDLATIRQIMKDHDITVACGLCYVEDRRQLLGEIAKGFIEEMRGGFANYAQGSETKKKNAQKFRDLLGDDTKEDLSIYDLITLEGSDKLAQEHPGIYAAFQAFNAARGQQAGNLFQGYAEYKREILNWSKKKVDSVNANGGLRIFSYSDFEAHHLIDLVQIIQDCARMGVMIQGYTKVPAFARAVANTGIKLNRSLIPLGDTGIVDGRLAYDTVEGIDINDKDFLPDNDNIGNILIGINDEQIRLAMADPFVHYIIPYHSNQSGILRKMKQTGAWTNYKNEQTEKGENVGKHGVNIYTDVLAAAEAEGKPIKNEKQFVERFLQVCKEKGWTPRFARFLNTNEAGEYVYTPGYYKLLLDFKLFDEKGRILPQRPVVAEFDDAFNQSILEDYAKDAQSDVDALPEEVYQEIVEKLGLEDRDSDIQFSIQGILGAGDDAVAMQNLYTAMDMEKAGKDAKTIWQATGWERGKDGKWRSEIPDGKAKAFPVSKRSLTVADIIDAPELFEAYPEIKGYKVSLKKISGAGAFVPSKKEIELDADYNTEITIPEERKDEAKEYFSSRFWANPGKAATLRREMEKKFGERRLDTDGMNTVMHELQHAIQSIEGFAKGGSEKGQAQDYLSKAYKTRPEAVTFARAFSSKNSPARLLRFGRERLAEYIMKNAGSITGGEGEATRRLESLRDYINGLDDWGYRNLVGEGARLWSNAQQIGKSEYPRLAGETEARNVEKRMGMSEEERRGTPLSETEDVAREEQVLRFSVSKDIAAKYPNWMDNQTTTEVEGSKRGQNTQVAGTVGTYKKVGSWIEKNVGKDAKVLDASSGLGLGTLELRRQGFNIDDIEPYPGKGREEQPTYGGVDAYQKAMDDGKEYDYIISNAVLNVIPDDWRDGVLHDMATLLKPGGRMFINTRKAGEEKTIKNKIELESPQEVLVGTPEKITSYQRFFTPQELKEYVERELGDGYTVEIANEKNSGTKGLAAVVVTKAESPRFSVTAEQDKEYMDAVQAGDMEKAQKMVDEAFKAAFPNTKVVDRDGAPMTLYHASGTKGITEFKKEKINPHETDASYNGFWFSSDENTLPAWVRKEALYRVYLNIENPILDRDADKVAKEVEEKILDNYDEDLYPGARSTADAVRMELQARGYDGVIHAYPAAIDTDELEKEGKTVFRLANGLRFIIRKGDDYKYEAYSYKYDSSDKSYYEGDFEGGFDSIEEIRQDPYFFGEQVWVAFEPSQIKSADPVTYDDNGNVIPLSERFNPQNEDIRFSVANRNQEVFVSNAQRALEGIRMEKATPEQWLKMLEKGGGLKAGEDKWLGLSDWLKAQDKKSLTKQEVLDYIDQNKIRIEEVNYGEADLSELQNEFDEIYDGIIDNGEDDVVYSPMERAWEDLRERHNGGDDFDMAFGLDNHGIIDVNDEDAAGYFLGAKPINQTRLDNTTDGLDNKREIALTVPTIEPWNESDPVHFGDAGEGRAVAWIRFGDATDEAGHKILVIDEIQSKRHQEGREQGYATPMSADEVKQREADYDAVADEMKAKYGSGVMGQAEYWDEVSAEDKARILEVRERYQETEKAKRGVRPAPFEKNWHELAMKRMLRYAAENGYDYVAWTTGEQQAERYDLSRTIHGLTVYDNGDGTYDLLTLSSDGTQQQSYSRIEQDKLADYVGKELAVKIARGENQEERKGRKVQYYRGLDLKIGGEGMKGFYDEMLPRFMDKYGKKWGVKVEDITLPGLEASARTMHAVPVNEAMKESVMQGQLMFSVTEQEQENRAKQIEEAEKNGLKGVIGEEGVSEIYREAYASIPKDDLKPIVEKGLAEGGDIRRQLKVYLHDLAKKGTENDTTGLLFKLFDDIRFMASNPALTDADIRWMLFKETSDANEGDLLALAEERAMRNRWGVGLLPAQQLFQDATEKAAEEATQRAEEAEQKVEEAKVATASEAVFSEAEKSLLNELKTLTKAMEAQKAYDKATVNGVVKFAKEILKNGRVSAMTAREVSRLLSLVNASTGKSPKFITRYVNQLMDMLLDHIVKQEEDRFTKLVNVKAKKVNQSGVEAQGKLDIIGQAIIKAFRENMDSPVEDIKKRIENVSDRILDDDDAIRKEAQAIYSGLMLALQYKENISENIEEFKDLDKEFKDVSVKLVDLIGRKAYDEFIRSSEEALRKNRMERIDMYRDLSQQLTDIIVGGVERATAFREAEKQRVEDIHHDASRDMKGTPAREQLRDNRWQRFLNSDFVRFFTKSLATADQMFRLLGRKSATGEGYLYNRYIKNGVIPASERASRGLFEAMETLDKKAAEVFDKPGMKWSDIYSIERKMPGMTVTFLDGGEMVDHELTQGNMLYIYMANKMQDGKMKLRRMGISEEEVAAIKKQLDPRFVELADWMQDEFYVNLRNKYNAVHERMFGAPMAAIDDYVPLKILSNARFQDVDLGNQSQSELSSTITGSIIKRRKNSLALDILHTDAFSLAIEHIEKMEDWAAFAEFRRDMNTLLSYKRFHNQVQNMNTVYGSGETLWRNFYDVCSVVTGAYKPKVRRGDIDRIALNAAKGVTGAKIAFRVNTAIKQLLSFPAYFSDARLDYLIKSLATPGQSWKWCMENLPLFEKRWKSRIAGDTRLLDTDSDWAIWKDNVVKTASRLGMTPNAFVDATTVAIGAKAMYDTKKAQYIKDGYSEEKADEMAKRDAEILYNQTQQSSENAFVSPVQLDRTVWAVTMTTYRNSSMAYQRQLHDAIRNTARMMKPGYRARSIEFMKNQNMNNGLSEEDAQCAAERQYNRQWYRNLARVAIFGYGLQFLWKIGNDMWYLLFGDDDDEKNKILEDAALAELAGPVEGLVGGNVISEAWGKKAEKKNNDKYGIKSQTMFSSGGLAELPLESDMGRINQQMDYDQPRAINGIIDLLVQSGVGVNPQTLTDAVVALIDYANGDLTDATNIALGVMRIAQIPQSTIERFMVDQIDMDDPDKRKEQTNEMAKQYAAYKVLKNAPLTRWMYNEDDIEKRLKSQEKAFKDAVKRRVALKEAISGEEVPETPEDFYKDFEKEMKSYQTDLNRAIRDKDTLTQQHLEAQPEYQQYVIWKKHQKGINKLATSIEKTIDENLKKQWEEQRRDSIQTVMKELNENK